MAPTPKHTHADRLRIAELSGALSNLSGKLRREELTLTECVAELHSITSDPHLLGHGLGGCVGDPGKWATDALPVRLALAAGVDLVEAAATHAEMHPRGARGLQLGRPE